MGEVKPGYLTTEFWAMLINLLLNALVAAGVLRSADVEPLGALLVPLVVAAAGVVAYVIGRSYVKSKARY